MLDVEANTNYLFRLAATNSVLISVFMIAGAAGHFIAVWPTGKNTEILPINLLLPSVLLAVSSAANISLCGTLWMQKKSALWLAIFVNVTTILYLSYLFYKGVPDHPIGVFLAFVLSHLILLSTIKVGLTWPSV